MRREIWGSLESLLYFMKNHGLQSCLLSYGKKLFLFGQASLEQIVRYPENFNDFMCILERKNLAKAVIEAIKDALKRKGNFQFEEMMKVLDGKESFRGKHLKISKNMILKIGKLKPFPIYLTISNAYYLKLNMNWKLRIVKAIRFPKSKSIEMRLEPPYSLAIPCEYIDLMLAKVPIEIWGEKIQCLKS